MRCLIVTVAVLTIAARSFATEVVRITTPRGATVEMLLDEPNFGTSHPLFVLAPGQGYHARLPLLEKIAQSLVARGVAVVRFNWAYFVSDPKSGKPSNELVDEIEDLRSVMRAAKAKKNIDSTRIVLGGKSLGTLAAWQVFHEDTTILALAQLTPVCIDMQVEKLRDATLENYRGIEKNSRPLLLLSGEIDPLCPSAYLYAAGARIERGVRISVIGGDHSFRVKDGKAAEQETQENLDGAVRITSDFVFSKLRK